MTHRLHKLLLAMALTFCVLPQAYADDVLENAPVTRRMLQYRAARHELAAMFNMTLGDPYTRNWLPGVRYDYHLLEWLSIGADAMFGISSQSDTWNQISSKMKAVNPDFVMESSSLTYLASAHVQAAPLVGKFVAFGTIPVQFDVHATLSIGLAGLTGGTEIAKVQGTFSPAPGVGGGFRLFFSKFVGLNLELADVFIKRSLAVTRDSKAPTPQFGGNLFFSAGISFFLPPDLKRAD